VLFVRSRPAARLRAARGRPAAARQVAAASATLTAADTAADRFGVITKELLAFPAPSSVPPSADEQLADVAGALARLEHAADQVAQAGMALTALAAAGQRSGQDSTDTSHAKLAAVLAEVAKLPTDRTTPDQLAAAVTRHTAPATVAAAPAGKPGPVTRIEAALPADPHVAARAELLSGLEALGLDGAWKDLRTWPEFSRQRDGYDARQLSHARDFARQVETARAREAAAMAHIPRQAGPRRAAGPLDPGDQRDAGARQMADELCAATTAYADQARALLGPGAERVPWLAAVPGLLAGCERQLRDGDLAGALAALAGGPLPVVPSWRPSQDYDAAWRRAADGLAEFADQYQELAARRATDTAARFRSAVTRLGEAADSGLAAWQTARDASWRGLQDAAAEVKRNAAAVLAAPGTSRDAAEPVRAAAAVLAVDQVAAANAAELVVRAFPEPGPAVPAAGTDEHVTAVEHMCALLDRHSVLLAGLDGVLSPLLAAQIPVSAGGLSGALAELTPIRADLAVGYKDALVFSHHLTAGLTWSGTGREFVHQVSGNILPTASPPGASSAFSITWELAKGGKHLGDTALNTVYHGGLLAAMDSSDPAVAIATSLGSGLAAAIGKQLDTHNPAVIDAQAHLEDAAHHAGHAAGLAAPDFLHAAVGHLPVVTLTLSSIREVRLLNEGATTAGRAVENVVIDVAGVAGGLTIGAIVASLIPGPHLLVTVPTAIGGVFAARKLVAERVKQRHLKEAIEALAAAKTIYAAASLSATARLEGTVRRELTEHRAAYLAALSAPPDTAGSAAELARLTARLRAATAAYLRCVDDVLAAGGRQAKTGTRAADLPVTREMPGLIRNCDAKLTRSEHASALLTLTASPLPAPQTWRPAREYRQLCSVTASRVAELCDGDRTKLARWATDSAALFRTHSDQAGAVINAEAERVAHELSPGAAAVRDADAVVTREAAMLGQKS
jgi:uncharacterized metal-binding protein